MKEPLVLIEFLLELLSAWAFGV